MGNLPDRVLVGVADACNDVIEERARRRRRRASCVRRSHPHSRRAMPPSSWQSLARHAQGIDGDIVDAQLFDPKRCSSVQVRRRCAHPLPCCARRPPRPRATGGRDRACPPSCAASRSPRSGCAASRPACRCGAVPREPSRFRDRLRHVAAHNQIKLPRLKSQREGVALLKAQSWRERGVAAARIGDRAFEYVDAESLLARGYMRARREVISPLPQPMSAMRQSGGSA
jgi:hypothetical protein